MFREYVTSYEYSFRAVGEELYHLPDIPICVQPLVNTSLHALAAASIAKIPSYRLDETGSRYTKVTDYIPQWCFRVKHSGGWRVRNRGPKISLYLDGSNHTCFTFKIGSRPVYKHHSEVFRDLAAADYMLKSTCLTGKANLPMDEEASMRYFNARRFEELSARGAVRLPVMALPVPPADDPEPTADIIDFAAVRARMTPVLSEADLLARLPLYG